MCVFSLFCTLNLVTPELAPPIFSCLVWTLCPIMHFTSHKTFSPEGTMMDFVGRLKETQWDSDEHHLMF